MRRNVEIKASVDDLDQLRRRVESLADRGPHVLVQEDTFFFCERGRLKLRRFSKREAELIFYERPDTAAPSESRHLIAPVADPDRLKEVLSSALGRRGGVRKRRTLYWSGRTRIHLDEVDGLGAFVEIEVVLEPDQTAAEGSALARELMERLQIEEEALVTGAYIDLLEDEAGP